MSYKTLEAICCDYTEMGPGTKPAQCRNIARDGVLPDGWVWVLWKRDIALKVGDNMQVSQRSDEFHFCDLDHFKAWKKVSGAKADELTTSEDKVKADA